MKKIQKCDPIGSAADGNYGIMEYSLIYYRGYGFLTPFGLKPFRCEIGLGVNVSKSGSGFFLSDRNLFVIIRVLEIWFRSEKGSVRISRSMRTPKPELSRSIPWNRIAKGKLAV